MDYSINQFFAQAHAIVAKSEIKNVTLECVFKVADTDQGPALAFSIALRPKEKETDSDKFEFQLAIAHGYGLTPQYCLCQFESDLMRHTHQTLPVHKYIAVLPDATAVEQE